MKKPKSAQAARLQAAEGHEKDSRRGRAVAARRRRMARRRQA